MPISSSRYLGDWNAVRVFRSYLLYFNFHESCLATSFPTANFFRMKAGAASISNGLASFFCFIILIIRVCSGPKMIRVYTGSIIAFMTSALSLLKRSMCYRIRNAMRAMATTLKTKTSVADRTKQSSPNPTISAWALSRRLINARPKTLDFLWVKFCDDKVRIRHKLNLLSIRVRADRCDNTRSAHFVL